MKELSGAIVVAALIIGAAIYFAALNPGLGQHETSRSGLYEMIPAASASWAYRINRQQPAKLGILPKAQAAVVSFTRVLEPQARLRT